MRFPLLIVLLCCLIPLPVAQAQGIEDPHGIVRSLRDQLYSIGESSPETNAFIAAEQQAALSMQRAVIELPDTATSLRDDRQRTPLMAAALNGYPSLVEALLVSEEVRRTLDRLDKDGLSAWDHATLAFHRSVWACNTMNASNPRAWIPRFVVQPYYANSETDVYRQTQHLLEAAGASMDTERPRQFWLKQCAGQPQRTRDRVMASTDLLNTLSLEGKQALNRFLSSIE